MLFKGEKPTPAHILLKKNGKSYIQKYAILLEKPDGSLYTKLEDFVNLRGNVLVFPHKLNDNELKPGLIEITKLFLKKTDGIHGKGSTFYGFMFCKNVEVIEPNPELGEYIETNNKYLKYIQVQDGKINIRVKNGDYVTFHDSDALFISNIKEVDKDYWKEKYVTYVSNKIKNKEMVENVNCTKHINGDCKECC